jgi:hypothetical protein
MSAGQWPIPWFFKGMRRNRLRELTGQILRERMPSMRFWEDHFQRLPKYLPEGNKNDGT